MGTAAGRFDVMAGDDQVLEPWYAHLYPVLDRLIRRALPPAAGRRPRALDAGCGTGALAAVLGDLGYVTHGLDLSPAMLAGARRRLPGAALARGDLEALPYPDDAFDAVVCGGSTLSFVPAPARAVGELGRVLRPGGRLVLEVEHAWSLDLGWTLLSSLAGDPLGYGLAPGEALRLLARRPGRGCLVDYPGYGRLRLFTRRELAAMLAGAGLTVERLAGVHMLTNLIPSTVLHRPRLPRGAGPLYRALARADDGLRRLPGTWRLANSLVVVAVKWTGLQQRHRLPAPRRRRRAARGCVVTAPGGAAIVHPDPHRGG